MNRNKILEHLQEYGVCNEAIYYIKNLEKEIERLNKQIEEYQKALDEATSEKIDLEKENGRIKMALDYIKNAEGNDINYIATLLLGYPVEIEEKRKQVLDILGSDKE